MTRGYAGEKKKVRNECDLHGCRAEPREMKISLLRCLGPRAERAFLSLFPGGKLGKSTGQPNQASLDKKESREDGKGL